MSEKQTEFHLWLSYPLKSISLNSFWRPVIEVLSHGHFVALEDIISITGNQSRKKVELFLNKLVRKGLLERTGVARMETIPRISIIIPVYNRPHDIAACLESLLKLDYPQDKYEIIVVDDASTDETPEVISRYPVKVIRNKNNRHASYSRNLAATEAKGDILAFIDSDCLADGTWLRELVPAFKDRNIAAVGGLVESYYNTRPLDRYEQVRSSLKMGLWPKRSAENNPFFYVPSCNLLVRRRVFLKIGGFDEFLVVGEDVDLCWRIHRQGFQIDYLPAGCVFHKHRSRLGAFCRRRFDYGTSEPLLNRLYPGKVKQMIFPIWASMFWVCLILAVLLESAGLLLFPVAILWLEAVYKFNKIKQKDLNIPFVLTGISVARSYSAFFYHCCAFFSRYYLIWFITLVPTLPLLAALLAAMHLLTGVVEYRLKKPKLGLTLFFIYFTMEQLSYQSGVWWQCLKLLSFRSVNPKITARVLHEN